MFFSTPEKKAQKLQNKGDKLFAKGKYRQAIQCYEKSEALHPDREEIYQKLVEALDQIKEEWSEADFSNSMEWTMRAQEITNPSVRFTYQRLSPEYEDVKKLVQALMVAPSEEMEFGLIEQIMEQGEAATLPALDMILSLKKFAHEAPEGDVSHDFPNQS